MVGNRISVFEIEIKDVVSEQKKRTRKHRNEL